MAPSSPHDQPPALPRPGPTPCPHCHEPGRLRPLAAGFERCAACDFVTPRPRRPRRRSEPPPLQGLALIAPGCVLRERYRLINLLGRGAHGLTYFAEHEFLNHPCVVKILPHRAAAESDQAVQRLRREAQAGFRVNDPHVVRVLDCDAIEGVWYFVTEYVDAADLAALIRQNVLLGWQQATRLAIDAAHGLAAIHRAGLLHRDIKPGNLLLGVDGRLRITDLGVVGLAEPRADGRESGPAAAGTLDYAAPEVLEAEAQIDGRTDLYSLGATLYHLVTGHPPHARDSVFATLIDAHSRPATWPDDAPADVPAWFAELVLRLLATDPDQRFASAETLLEHLSRPHAPAEVIPPVRPSPGLAVQPRGLTVLPFENDTAAAGDDWLGFALADSLSRELSRTSSTYLADHEQFLAVLASQTGPQLQPEPQQLLAAGRLVGAATVITGRFRRTAAAISLWADVHRHGHADSVHVGPIEGALSKLIELQGKLFEKVAGVLQIALAEGVATRAPAGGLALETRAKFTRGKQAYLQGEYETAIELASETLAEDPTLIEAAQYMSACYARLGHYEQAQRYHQQIVAAAQERDDRQLLVEAQANLGVMYYLKGEYQTAYEHYTEARQIAEELNLPTERAQICNNIGFALFRLGRPQEAEAAFRLSVDICKRYGALAALIGPYNGLGNLMLEQQRYDEAADFYRRALTLAQETGDRTNSGVSHMHLGRCASLQGRFPTAKNEFALALNTLEGTSSWNVRARTYEYIAEMNMRLGNYTEAVRCADKKIELARRHANWTMESLAWRQRAEALSQMGRTAEAQASLARAAQAESKRSAAPAGR